MNTKQRANELAKNKIHPTTIISGYKTALKEAINYIKEKILVKVDTLGDEGLINAAKTSMSSKLIGPENALFAPMVVQAMKNVRTEEGKHPIKSVHIVK